MKENFEILDGFKEQMGYEPLGSKYLIITFFKKKFMKLIFLKTKNQLNKTQIKWIVNK